ncbi:hypothetical protein GH714_019928 [Hevea brasiliensis]|uniref:WRKY domain-containing protein n=1 Tax=Hevea brasiliensis TaxID=3981 RepID=A0A6A6LYZ3_HEVBR|nr:hypothetical protein GH714_019928 [Hevea brasiliensis]
MESLWPETLLYNRRKAIEQLTRGQEYANQLKAIFSESIGDDGSVGEDLVTKILNSFMSSLSILNGVESDEVSQLPASIHVGSPCCDGRKSEDSGESIRSTSTMKDRKGCYKRRKTSQYSWTRDSPDLIDDGHAWRKYGQKVILNAKYPRNYFRCTHKFDQGCQATKQVQRIEEEPPMHRTTYYGHHTCKNLLKASHLILDAPDHVIDSSVLLSFSNGNGHHNNHPTNRQDAPFFSTFQSIKQECKDGFPHDHNNHLTHNQSSSSDYLVSPDDHASKFDPADVISGVNSSCTATSTTTHHSLDMDMIMTSVDSQFDDILEFECFDG